MNLDMLDTPALLLDLDKLDNNIKKMNKHLNLLGVKIRPHGKTSKNINIIKRVLGDELKGITVSTLKEAVYYFSHGIDDIVYAVGITPKKLERLTALIHKGCKIALVLDSVEQVKFVASQGQSLNFEFHAFIEVDSDGHRLGVKPDSDELLTIGKNIHKTPGIALDGVLTHAGDSYACESIECIKRLALRERDAVILCASRLKQAGLPCPNISVGSSPTATFTDDLTGVTEARPGAYMIGDLVMAGLGVCNISDIALSVLTSVTGWQKEKGWLITDAGWMAMSQDHGTANQRIDQGYGLVCDLMGRPIDDLYMAMANQEHGVVVQRNGQAINWDEYPIGRQLRILPSHACTTAAMFDGYHVLGQIREVEAYWARCRGW